MLAECWVSVADTIHLNVEELSDGFTVNVIVRHIYNCDIASFRQGVKNVISIMPMIHLECSVVNYMLMNV